MNKHDELLRKIEDLLEEARSHINLAIDAKNLNFAVARATEARFDIRQITSRLQSLAADFQLLADEYEKLREMGKEVQDRLTWTIKACTVDRDAKFELESLLSTVEDALKAQQSGEEGER